MGGVWGSLGKWLCLGLFRAWKEVMQLVVAASTIGKPRTEPWSHKTAKVSERTLHRKEKPSLLRISALLFLYASCLLIILLLRGACTLIPKNFGESYTPGVVTRSVYPEYMSMDTNNRMKKEPMPNMFTMVVSESSNLALSAPTPASLQRLTWWLRQSRALTNTFLSCAWTLMTCANSLRLATPSLCGSAAHSTWNI